MVSQKVTVINKLGLHARPANLFVKEANACTCSVFVEKGGKRANGKSIVQLMSAYIKCGNEIEIFTDGDGEQEALTRLVELVNSGLGEEE